MLRFCFVCGARPSHEGVHLPRMRGYIIHLAPLSPTLSPQRAFSPHLKTERLMPKMLWKAQLPTHKCADGCQWDKKNKLCRLCVGGGVGGLLLGASPTTGPHHRALPPGPTTAPGFRRATLTKHETRQGAPHQAGFPTRAPSPSRIPDGSAGIALRGEALGENRAPCGDEHLTKPETRRKPLIKPDFRQKLRTKPET